MVKWCEQASFDRTGKRPCRGRKVRKTILGYLCAAHRYRLADALDRAHAEELKGADFVRLCGGSIGKLEKLRETSEGKWEAVVNTGRGRVVYRPSLLRRVK